MAYEWATWLADVLRAAGVRVVEEPGWATRGRPGGTWTPRGVMMHHDASPPGETSAGADVIINGRPGLEGPLAQLWLAYDGTWHVCAAGRANHAGEGAWGSIPRDDGNEFCIGIETDHTTNEDWSDPQRSSALRGVAALCEHLGIRTEQGLQDWFCAHKEYAAGRKPDPDPLDMAYARAQLLGVDTLEGFVQQIRKANTVAQVIEADSKWHTIRLSRSDDPTGVYGVTAGPWHWLLDVAITTDDMPVGEVLLMRAVSTEGDADDVVSGAPIGAGSASDRSAQHFTYSAQGWTDEGQWLRVQVQTTYDVSLTKVETATTVW